MTKANFGAELDESRCLRCAGRVPAEPEALGRIPQQRRVSERLGGGKGQQEPGIRWQRPQPLREPVLELPERRDRARLRQSVRELRRRPRPRQLQQRKWVPVTLGENALLHSRIGRASHDRAE